WWSGSWQQTARCACPRFLDQRGDGRLDRVAIRHDKPDRVENLGFDDRNGAQSVIQLNSFKCRIGYDARPFANADMSHQRAYRIRFKQRLGLNADTAKDAVHDAAALQIAAEEA